MNSGNNKRRSQDAHIRRDGQPMVPTYHQQQQHQHQHQHQQHQHQHQQTMAYWQGANIQPQYPMPMQQRPVNGQHPQFHGAPLQQNMLMAPRQGAIVQPQDTMAIQQWPAYGQHSQMHGAPLQQNIHDDCHSAAHCPWEEKLKNGQGFSKLRDEELSKLRQEISDYRRDRFRAQKNRPEPSDLEAEVARLRAELAWSRAELANFEHRLGVSELEVKMLREHIASGNGTPHNDPQATSLVNIGSSPPVLTPLSSPPYIPAGPRFPDDGTFQQRWEDGQEDGAVAAAAEAAAAAVAGMNTTHFDTAASHLYGGLHNPPSLTDDAAWGGNSAWTGIPGQTQQYTDPAAAQSYGGLRTALPGTATGQWSGNLDWPGVASQLPPDVIQQPNYTTIPSATPETSLAGVTGPDTYAPAQLAPVMNYMAAPGPAAVLTNQFASEFSENSGLTWVDAVEQIQTQQPNYTPAIDVNGMLAPVADIALEEPPAADTITTWAWDDLLDWTGGIE